ncbi:hypothetical protein [Galactobacter valiniphilus]|uniref:hypothetical protein n=1 Tax=Galactobacter valiniphilus TaxID=2676122 RepID=UPI0037366DC1
MAAVADMVRDVLPLAEIVYVSDERSSAYAWPQSCDVIRMTNEALASAGLFHERENVGWVCGDYAYALLLERQWDFAWLIEPDVALVGTAAELVRQADAGDADLIGTRIGVRPAEWNWPWRDRWLHLRPTQDDVQGLFFPLTRLSRSLASAVLQTRQEMTEPLKMDESARVPNDEVVVATVAYYGGYQTLDLKQLSPELFDMWNWVVRYPREGLDRSALAGAFVHPSLDDAGYEKFVRAEAHAAITGARPASERLVPSMRPLQQGYRARAAAWWSEELLRMTQ